jgi:hypothetical protein
VTTGKQPVPKASISDADVPSETEPEKYMGGPAQMRGQILMGNIAHELERFGNAQFLEMSMTNFPAEMKDRVRIILEETDRISRVTKKLREIKKSPWSRWSAVDGLSPI